MKRAIVMVIDSMGIGAMDDCRDFGDVPECNTLKNVCEFNGGLNVPNMEKLGLGNIQDFMGISSVKNPIGSYGTMIERSKGKDTTTGHWEMMGLISQKPFATFPDGFPDELLEKFIQETNCGGVLANRPASGTAIIAELNEEHHKTGFPIVYTSADSVFQIALDTDFIPLETLYKWCEIARRLLDEGNYNVSRVIARPYKIIDGKPTRISKDRRDYSMIPSHTILNDLKDEGKQVIAIGKIEDIFSKSGITHAIHTGSNREGLELTLKAVKGELDLEKIAYDKAARQLRSEAAENIEGRKAGGLEGKPVNENSLSKISQDEQIDKNLSTIQPFNPSTLNSLPSYLPIFQPSNSLIFTNLVDTDMLYGHRNDAKGYGKAIEEIDTYVDDIIENMKDEDLLIITADHGCDPTVEGTDHTREKVPVLVYSKTRKPENLGEISGFDYVAKIVKEHLG